MSGGPGAEFGYNSNGGFFTNATYNGNPMGPSVGFSNSGKITNGNSQGGFHNMQNANFNSELAKTVALAELKAYNKYWENTSNWVRNVEIARTMTYEWATGTGETTRTFSNDNVSDEMINAPGVNKARDYFYDIKYKGVRELDGASLTDFSSGFFGPMGAYEAGLNPIRQFVGGFSVNIHSDGDYLNFTVYNRTSFKSFFLDIGLPWERTTFAPGGNTYQYHKWTEPIK